MLELTQADNGKSVEARPVDLITIRLPEKPYNRLSLDRGQGGSIVC